MYQQKEALTINKTIKIALKEIGLGRDDVRTYMDSARRMRNVEGHGRQHQNLAVSRMGGRIGAFKASFDFEGKVV